MNQLISEWHHLVGRMMINRGIWGYPVVGFKFQVENTRQFDSCYRKSPCLTGKTSIHGPWLPIAQGLKGIYFG